MAEDIFDNQLEAAVQRLEQLWERTNTLPFQPGKNWQTFNEIPSQPEELVLLKESLHELGNSLQELQCMIEELRQQNEELAATQMSAAAERQRYKELFDFTPFGYLVTDAAGLIEEANQTAAKLLKVRSDRLIGKPLVVYVNESSRHDFLTKLLQLRSGKSVEDWEVQIQPRDGEPFPAICTVVPVQDSSGRVECLRWHLRDITKRKQSREVEQKLKMLDDILYASPVKIYLIDRTGKYLYASPAGAEILGLEQAEIVGKTWQQLGFPASIMETIDAQREKVSIAKSPIADECSLPTVKGVRNYEYTISPMLDTQTGVDAVVLTLKDITKHKEAEAEINKALAKQREINEVKARLLSIVSHEIRNPLTNIFSSAELLTNYAQNWDEQRKKQQLQHIQASVKQINNLFNDLLLVSKAEAGKLQVNPALLDLENFSRQLVEQMQSSVGNKHTLTFSIEGKHTSACLDEKLLWSILTNLLSNAIKYSPAGSNIEFNLICQGREAVFQVKDTGIGIPKKDREQLFDWFRRGSNVGKVEGIGLGLSIVKQCVDLHNGNIVVESEEGMGTRITVSLPLRQMRSRSVRAVRSLSGTGDW